MIWLEVSEVRMVDQIKCFECGKIEYKPSTGKSSRTYVGVCDDHQMNFDDLRKVVQDGVSKANESREKSKGVPEGAPSKG